MQQAASNRSLDKVYSAWMSGMWQAAIAEGRRRERAADSAAGAKAFWERMRWVVVRAIGRVRVQMEILQIEGDGDVQQWLENMADTERAVREELGM